MVIKIKCVFFLKKNISPNHRFGPLLNPKHQFLLAAQLDLFFSTLLSSSGPQSQLNVCPQISAPLEIVAPVLAIVAPLSS